MGALASLPLAAAAASTADVPNSFKELLEQRRKEGFRLTYDDYPRYNEDECVRLIDETQWGPGGQVPLSCMMDRIKRIHLLAQDIWSVSSEASLKLTGRANNPKEWIDKQPALLQAAEREAAAERAAPHEMEPPGEHPAAEPAFLETAAQPVAPTTLPQIGSLLKALVEVLNHANEAVGHLASSNGAMAMPN